MSLAKRSSASLSSTAECYCWFLLAKRSSASLDEVLYLMYYHGYITENEYYVAKSTKVEDFLKDSSNNNRGAGQGTPYQAYIDQVVEEVYELTGLDPYTTSMRIYTAMDKSIQERMDDIQAEKVDDNYYRKEADKDPYFYPNDKFEVASICVT